MSRPFTFQFELTKQQLHDLIIQHIKKQNGLQDIKEALIKLLLTEQRADQNHLPISHNHLSALTLSLLRSQQQKIDQMSGELCLQGKSIEKIARITEKLFAEKHMKTKLL